MMRINCLIILWIASLLGCSNTEQAKPYIKDLPRLELVALTVNRTPDSLELKWADSLSIPADRECRVAIPLEFASEAEILTGSIYVSNDRGVVVQSGGGSYSPNRSLDPELSFELSKIPAGTYSYEFTFLSGPDASEVTKLTGKVVVK